MFIKKIKIQNILSFKEETFCDLQKFNILIGKNSSGKSNFIRAITFVLRTEDLRNMKKEGKLSNYFFEKGDAFLELEVTLEEKLKKLSINVTQEGIKHVNDEILRKKIERNICDIPPFRNILINNLPKTGDPRIDKDVGNQSGQNINPKILSDNFYAIVSRITGLDLKEIKPIKFEIDKERESAIDNLFCKLINNSSFRDDHRSILEIGLIIKKLIMSLNLFEIYKKPTITNPGYYSIEIVDKMKVINLDLLGWGTKSIIIFIYDILFQNKKLFFLEEPEISTHPEILGNFFKWLKDDVKDCQFFFTTHSSKLLDIIFTGLDSDVTKIIKFWKDNDGKSKASELSEKKEKIRTLMDLGYRSSNLLLSNYLIWVEGPSDLYYYEAFILLVGYLNYLNSGNKREILIKGHHYEIMGYGGESGRYIFNLKNEDDILQMLSLNRNVAVFWDYDLKNHSYPDGLDVPTKYKNIHKHLKDLRDNKETQFNVIAGLTGKILVFSDKTNEEWLRKGPKQDQKDFPRTIENFIPGDLLQKFLLEIRHNGFKQTIETINNLPWTVPCDIRVQDLLTFINIQIKKGKNSDEIKALLRTGRNHIERTIKDKTSFKIEKIVLAKKFLDHIKLFVDDGTDKSKAILQELYIRIPKQEFIQELYEYILKANK